MWRYVSESEFPSEFIIASISLVVPRSMHRKRTPLPTARFFPIQTQNQDRNNLAITTTTNSPNKYRISGVTATQNSKVIMIRRPGGAKATSRRCRSIPMEMQLSITLFSESCCLPDQLVDRPSLDRTLSRHSR